MDIINRYKNQNTKGIKGIKKVISEEISIWKYYFKTWLYLKLNNNGKTN